MEEEDTVTHYFLAAGSSYGAAIDKVLHESLNEYEVISLTIEPIDSINGVIPLTQDSADTLTQKEGE